ncbi:hypothetical protein J7M28_04905 [bacterium]|nr:hypothetical protein [bacterium]
MPPVEKTRRIANTIIVVMFVFWIFVPIIEMFTRIEGQVYLSEKRFMAKAPQWGVDPIAKWPQKFYNYFIDNFGFRKTLIYWHALLKINGLGVSSSDKVVIGKDGWLFSTNSRMIEDHQGLVRFSQQDLMRWKNALEQRRDWLAERGIHYLFVIAPDKSSIYPEFLPDSARRLGVTTRLDQFMEYMRKNSDVEILDLRESLLKAKGEHQLYFKHDTHWNVRGSLIAYQEVCKRLSKWFPDIRPLELDEFKLEKAKRKGDLYGQLGLRADLRQDYDNFVPRAPRTAKKAELKLDKSYPWPKMLGWRAPLATENERGKHRLLLFHDSFFRFAPRESLFEHFRRSVRIVLRPDFELFKLMVEQEAPDVVIEQRVERVLPSIPTEHPRQRSKRSGQLRLK